MKGIKYPVFTVLFILFLCGSVSAQNQRDWWYTLERGKVMFRQGDYGNALLAFDDARRQRRTMFERMERDLIALLSLSEVRRIGDSLDWVERYAQERNHPAAAAALNELYYRVPKESFKNSAAAALDALSSLKDYPEAEQWIGETYLIEGELSLALDQFQKALVLQNIFENPGYATELRYKIASIRRTRQEYNEMERLLLSVLNGDRLWSGDTVREALRNPQQENDGNAEAADQPLPFARQAMTRTLENNGVNRFITLYRYGNTESAQAHRLLGFYYSVSGRHARAQEHLMFAFLIQNTMIIDEIIRRHFDFTFTTLDALAEEINHYPVILDYVEKSEYYKTAYYLGASLYGNGKTASAMGIWNFISSQKSAGEWQARSQAQLRNPHIERALEMP
ncbi:MAG: hypothetical protein FWH38_05070 [Treponema sp.]|nr:hypothetical protein [Treponema sp.]